MELEEKYLNEMKQDSEWFNIKNNAVKNKKMMSLVRKVSKELHYDIWQTAAFILELMEDVNMHEEARYIEKYFDKNLAI